MSGGLYSLREFRLIRLATYIVDGGGCSCAAYLSEDYDYEGKGRRISLREEHCQSGHDLVLTRNEEMVHAIRRVYTSIEM